MKKRKIDQSESEIDISRLREVGPKIGKLLLECKTGLVELFRGPRSSDEEDVLRYLKEGLSDRQKTVLDLLWGKGLPIQEVQTMMSLDKHKIKDSVQLAKKEIKKSLDRVIQYW